MNCNETQTWLLQSESPALPPPPLADHLRRCGHCQEVQRQLVVVETQLQRAPLQLVPPPVRARLMNAIQTTPVVVPASRSLVKRKRRRFPLEHVIGYLAAAAASAIVGAVLGYGISERNRPELAVNPPPGTSVRPNEATTTTAHSSTSAMAIAAESTTSEQAAVSSSVTEPSHPAAMSVAETAQPTPMPLPGDTTTPQPFPQPSTTSSDSLLANARVLSDDELLAVLVESHTQLATTSAAADRLAQLASLADTLWTQAIKETQSSSTGNVDWLSDAYANIVESELPALARELSKESEARTRLAGSLKQRAQEVASVMGQATASDEQALLEQLQQSAELSAERLVADEKDPARPKQRRSSGSTNLLPMVVEQTIALAREENPLERADASTVVVEGIAKDILVTSLRGDEERAAALGGYFGRVVEQGVASNLQRVDLSKSTYQQTRHYQQVVGRTQQSILFLQQSLEAAPPGAKQSLAIAMQQGGLAQLVPPPGPTRRVWIWSPKHFRWHPPHPRH